MEHLNKAIEALVLHALLIGLATQAMMQTLGRVTVVLRPHWYEHTAFRAFVAASNLIWGVVACLLIEGSMGWRHRVLLGLIGGAFSAVIYEVALKRFKTTAVAPKPEPASEVLP